MQAPTMRDPKFVLPVTEFKITEFECYFKTEEILM